MKIILVDAIHCLITRDGNIVQEMYDLLEKYPNKKYILTNADDDESVKFKLNTLPYEIFTLNIIQRKLILNTMKFF